MYERRCVSFPAEHVAVVILCEQDTGLQETIVECFRHFEMDQIVVVGFGESGRVLQESLEANAPSIGYLYHPDKRRALELLAGDNNHNNNNNHLAGCTHLLLIEPGTELQVHAPCASFTTPPPPVRRSFLSSILAFVRARRRRRHKVRPTILEPGDHNKPLCPLLELWERDLLVAHARTGATGGFQRTVGTLQQAMGQSSSCAGAGGQPDGMRQRPHMMPDCSSSSSSSSDYLMFATQQDGLFVIPE